MIFNIVNEPYEKGVKIFNKKKLELEPNSISCLVGCNGSGKTTLCELIKREVLDNFKTKEIVVDYFHNTFKGIIMGNSQEEYDAFILDFDKHTDVTTKEDDYFTNAFSIAYTSTGEGIMGRLGKHMSVIGSTIRILKDKRLFIFLDDCDAGTSLDMIVDIKNIFNYIVEDCKKNNLEYYIILTANSYELCKDFDCISVHDFKHKKFRTYDSYKKFVLKSREEKNKRYDDNERESY